MPLACNPYVRHLRAQLRGATMPRHVGIIMDGNRRWARAKGLAGIGRGHERGAAHLEDFLDWCEQLRIDNAPDLDLVVRTSGERRVSNFLLWQSVRARLYFCDAYWPAFREADFLRVLRSYATSTGQLRTASTGPR